MKLGGISIWVVVLGFIIFQTMVDFVYGVSQLMLWRQTVDLQGQIYKPVPDLYPDQDGTSLLEKQIQIFKDELDVAYQELYDRQRELERARADFQECQNQLIEVKAQLNR